VFSSKYIFETRNTRYWRYLKTTVVLSIASIFLFTTLCMVFILFSKSENKVASDHFFKKPPDLIVVFTGDYGRISYALKKSEEYRQPHLFVTGVFSKNTVNSLLNSLNVSERFDSSLIEIDYLARNTVENSIATVRYLRSKKTMSNVLVISHDYHIMRIKLIMNTILRSTDNYQFYYMGIDSNYLKPRNLKILFLEAFKLLRTFGFLLFWDPQ
jgi:uncharacterized SAM-binding protein YcdF (DUF218 family)